MTEEQVIAGTIRLNKWGHRTRILCGLCSLCGEAFWCRKVDAKYCSPRCSQKATLREGHFRWKGGVVPAGNGYTKQLVPDHPKARGGGYVHQHVLVMEGVVGRFMRRGENVHHKNGIRSDNRPENLEIWITPQPSGQRVEDLVAWVVDHYAEDVRSKLQIKDLINSVIARVTSEKDSR